MITASCKIGSCCWDCEGEHTHTHTALSHACDGRALQVASYPLIDRPRNYRCVWSDVARCRRGAARSAAKNLNLLTISKGLCVGHSARHCGAGKNLLRRWSSCRGFKARACCNWFHAVEWRRVIWLTNACDDVCRCVVIYGRISVIAYTETWSDVNAAR